MSTDSCVSEMAHTHTFKPRNWRRRTFTGSTVAVLCGSSPPSDSSPSHTLSTAVLHLSLRGKRLMNLRVFLVELPSYSGCPHRPRLSQKSQAHPVLVRPWVEASPSSGDHTAATRGLRELQRVGAPSPEPVKGPWMAVGSSVRNDSLRPRASQDSTGSHIFLCVCLTHHLPRL